MNNLISRTLDLVPLHLITARSGQAQDAPFYITHIPALFFKANESRDENPGAVRIPFRYSPAHAFVRVYRVSRGSRSRLCIPDSRRRTAKNDIGGSIV